MNDKAKRPAHKAAPDAPVYKPPSEQSAQYPVAKPGEPIPQEVLDLLPSTGGGPPDWAGGPPDWAGPPVTPETEKKEEATTTQWPKI